MTALCISIAVVALLNFARITAARFAGIGR